MSERHRQHVMKHGEHNNTTPPANPARVISASTKDVLDEQEPATGEEKSVKGAFERLKAGLRAYAAATGCTTMTKSVPASDYDADAACSDIRSMQKTTAPRKSITTVLANAAAHMTKSLALPTGTSLVAGYGTDSSDLTGGSALRQQSLQKKCVYSGDQLLKAGEQALRDGKITAGEAYHLSSAVTMGKHPGDDIGAKLKDYLPQPKAQ
ncbi:hypothetical protein ACFPTO_02200 [Paraburkholderia denitrificans]|uniref:Uncharacterized protein n=1 Tax=Paraburkholderia denitrificans TaxID=694025 RepID=A0ABW0J3L3_9BURK